MKNSQPARQAQVKRVPSALLNDFDPFRSAGGVDDGFGSAHSFGASSPSTSASTFGSSNLSAPPPNQRQAMPLSHMQAAPAMQPLQPKPADISSVFAPAPTQQQIYMAQQRQQAAMMVNQNKSLHTKQAASIGNAMFAFGLGGGSDEPSGFGGADTFGNDGFGQSKSPNTSSGFDLDVAAAAFDEEEARKAEKEKQRKRKELARKQKLKAEQEEKDRQMALKLQQEEEEERRRQAQNALPRGWTRNHRGDITGNVYERVTTKVIGHKWSPRAVVITHNSFILRKTAAEKRGQARSIPITEFTVVGKAYINPEQAGAMLETSEGRKKVYQFKIIEQEPWGQEPKQMAKLGSTDLGTIKFPRNLIKQRVAALIG